MSDKYDFVWGGDCDGITRNGETVVAMAELRGMGYRVSDVMKWTDARLERVAKVYEAAQDRRLAMHNPPRTGHGQCRRG